MKKTVPIPRHLVPRPMWRGLPIPFIALIKPDGEPDFRVTDEAARMWVIMNVRCQLCAKPLGKWMFFVGGTQAAESNAYFEPAAHLDCVIYAMQVCPFILGKIEHADLGKIQKQYSQPVARVCTDHVEKTAVTIKTIDNVLAARNPYWVIKKATGYTLTKTDAGTVLIVPIVVKATKPLHAETMSAQDWADVRDLLL